MGRQELAASIIDRVHKDQVSQGHISSSVRRVISDLEQKTAAGSGAAGLAAAVDRHSNKKQRINGGSEALQDGSAVHDVIKAFLTGSDALSNTKVCWRPRYNMPYAIYLLQAQQLASIQ